MNKQWKDLFSPQLKLIDDGADTGSFAGYASTYGNVDSGGDIVVRGAFAQTIPAFLKDGFIALGHDWNGLQIGYPTAAREDDYGLWLEGVFHSTPEAQNARTVMKERIAAGKSVGLSIGYGAMPSGVEYRDDGVRLLKTVDLFEVSMVTVPMNMMASVSGAKDANASTPVQLLSDLLKALDADPTALGAALSYAEHLELVAALTEVLAGESKAVESRSADRLAIRAKEGRTFSQRNMDALATHAASLHDIAGGIEKMLNDNRPANDVIEEPKPNPKKSAELAAWVEAMRTDLAVRYGVAV